MIFLFLRGCQQRLSSFIRFGHERLASVERLRADFASVVDAHKPACMLTLGVR